MLSESTVETTRKLATATDSAAVQMAPGEGYIASFHDTIKGVALVWAPCGCRLAVGVHGESLVTLCMSEKCVFEWDDAAEAYKLLAGTPVAINDISVAVKEPGEEIAEAEVPE